MIPFKFNPLGKNGKVKEDGSEQFPFLIKTPQDFKSFRDAITKGTSFAGVYHKLTSDIDLSGITLSPHTTNERYDGIFNGNFKKISNITYSSSVNYCGVFACVYGKIKNTGFENINISSTSGSNYCGGIVGNLFGIVEQCYVTGALMVRRGGGIAGSCKSGSVVRNCWTNVALSCADTNGGGIASFVTDIVDKCYAIGNITGVGASKFGIGNINVKNCVAGMASITGTGNRISGAASTGLVNNFALSTMTVNGTTVSGGTSTNVNGADATISQLKSLAFYRDTMGWDMNNIWQIDDGNDFPKLRGFK